MKLKRLKDEYVNVRKELHNRIEENNSLRHELVECRLKNDYNLHLTSQTFNSLKSVCLLLSRLRSSLDRGLRLAQRERLVHGSSTVHQGENGQRTLATEMPNLSAESRTTAEEQRIEQREIQTSSSRRTVSLGVTLFLRRPSSCSLQRSLRTDEE